MTEAEKVRAIRAASKRLRHLTTEAAALYHEAVTSHDLGLLCFVGGLWGDDEDKGRQTLGTLLASGVVRYDSSELQYFGRASDGAEVMLGNPGPSVWRYLCAFSRPDQW